MSRWFATAAATAGLILASVGAQALAQTQTLNQTQTTGPGPISAGADDDRAQPVPPPAPGERTISKYEIWKALYPANPTDPNNPYNDGGAGAPGADVPVSADNALGHRYHWSYSRADPKTGLPLEIQDGDARRGEIDDDRVQCIKLISKMFDENGLPAHIPVSKFDNLEDQAAEMVLGCVDNLKLRHERGMKGVGALVCEAHTGHCWGPGDVWAPRTQTIRR